jgi:hypothetical protein
MDTYKVKEKQNPNNGYEIFRIIKEKKRRDRNINKIFRE